MKIRLGIGAIVVLLGVAAAQNQSNPPQTSATPAPAAATTPAPAKSLPAELPTQGYKGTLIDAACAGTGAQASAPPAANAAANSSSTCGVSANTKEFALRTNGGQTYRFDAVGNQRAEEAMKNKKKWTDLASAGKPIHAKVSAALAGDRLTVVSIN
jgi:hypothetical protein